MDSSQCWKAERLGRRVETQLLMENGRNRNSQRRNSEQRVGWQSGRLSGRRAGGEGSSCDHWTVQCTAVSSTVQWYSVLH